MINETGGVKTEPLYSFSIERAVLLAVQLFQSGDETRSAICATKFEIRKAVGPHALTLVATDGRRLGTHDSEIITDSLLSGELPDDDGFSIDLSGVKKLPKAKAPQAGQVSVAVFERHVEIQSGKYTYSAQKVEEKFPEWRQILPADAPAGTAEISFNHKLLAAFGKAAKLLTDSENLRVILRGKDQPIEITMRGDTGFRGVLMPLKFDDGEKKSEPTATETASGAKGPALK